MLLVGLPGIAQTPHVADRDFRLADAESQVDGIAEVSGDAQQAAGLQAQAIHFGPRHLVEEDVRQHRTQAVPAGVLLHRQEEHLARQEAPEQLVAVLPFP
ncbi:hypothetical protein D3C81_1455800 [compost metagenome]